MNKLNKQNKSKNSKTVTLLDYKKTMEQSCVEIPMNVNKDDGFIEFDINEYAGMIEKSLRPLTLDDCK